MIDFAKNLYKPISCLFCYSSKLKKLSYCYKCKNCGTTQYNPVHLRELE